MIYTFFHESSSILYDIYVIERVDDVVAVGHLVVESLIFGVELAYYFQVIQIDHVHVLMMDFQTFLVVSAAILQLLVKESFSASFLVIVIIKWRTFLSSRQIIAPTDKNVELRNLAGFFRVGVFHLTVPSGASFQIAMSSYRFCSLQTTTIPNQENHQHTAHISHLILLSHFITRDVFFPRNR